MFGKKKQKSKSTEENTERDTKTIMVWNKGKRIWRLTENIYNNQNNNNFKIIRNKKTYDLKNPNKFWMEVTTGKISKSEAKKSYKELIGKDPDALEREREKSSDIRKYNM